MKNLPIPVALLLVALVLAPAADCEEEPTLLETFTKGGPVLNLRYRYENVNDDALEKEAHASTLRTVVGYKTRTWKGLGFYIETENVSSIDNHLYNNSGNEDLNNGVQDRPVVADPAITDLSQTFPWFEKSCSYLQLGREQINVDDQRSIGSVAWRQHHQSFNAFKFTNLSLEWASFLYSHLDKVHRVDGATWDTSSHPLNAGFRFGRVGTLTPDAYLLDFQNAPQFGLFSASYGLELAGKYEIGGRKDLYLALYGMVGPVKGLAVFHDFSAENTRAGNDAEYGDERDYQFLYTAPWTQSRGLKGALYFADEFSTDTDKFWASTTYKT